MAHKRLLIDLGLKEAEAEIFLLVLKGYGKVSMISKKTRIKRPNIYGVLDTLVKKGLIGRKRVSSGYSYFAMPLDQLPVHLEKKAEEMQARVQMAKQVIPLLAEMKSRRGLSEVIHYGDGRGITAIQEDILLMPDETEILRINSNLTAKITVPYAPKNYWQRRDDKGLYGYLITNREYVEERWVRYESQKSKFLRGVRVMDSLKLLGISMLIYQDRVAVIEYEPHLSATLTIHKGYAEMMRILFWSIYENLEEFEPKS